MNSFGRNRFSLSAECGKDVPTLSESESRPPQT